jgi:hypothetical protein
MAGCERYFADTAPNTNAAAPLRSLCTARGTAVSAWRAADVKTRGVKLVRAQECGLPSGAYGAYHRDPSDRGDFRYDWPDYSSRDPSLAQPCIGAFVDAEARDEQGVPMGRWWMFVKAVADFDRVAFPYQERDPDFGSLASQDGVPRGEFVISRWQYGDGVGAYLGKTPIWLLCRLQLDAVDGPFSRPEFFASKLAACDRQAKPPCILPKQPAFFFPMTDDAVWVRAAIDTSDPRWPDPDSGTAIGRNPFEDANAIAGRVDTTLDVGRNTVRFFLYKTLAPSGLGFSFLTPRTSPPASAITVASAKEQATPPPTPVPVFARSQAGSGVPAPVPAATGTAEDEVDIDAFIAENNLPSDIWTDYEARSLEELTAMQAAMDERFTALKAATDAQTKKRSELLAEGRSDEAERVLSDELLPAFEERRRIGAQAVLLARAKIERRSAEVGEALRTRLPRK